MSQNFVVSIEGVKKYTSEILYDEARIDSNLLVPYKEPKKEFERVYFTGMLQRANGSISKLSELTQQIEHNLFGKFRT